MVPNPSTATHGAAIAARVSLGSLHPGPRSCDRRAPPAFALRFLLQICRTRVWTCSTQDGAARGLQRPRGQGDGRQEPRCIRASARSSPVASPKLSSVLEPKQLEQNEFSHNGMSRHEFRYLSHIASRPVLLLLQPAPVGGQFGGWTNVGRRSSTQKKKTWPNQDAYRRGVEPAVAQARGHGVVELVRVARTRTGRRPTRVDHIYRHSSKQTGEVLVATWVG